jgi:hypothetical protein
MHPRIGEEASAAVKRFPAKAWDTLLIFMVFSGPVICVNMPVYVTASGSILLYSAFVTIWVLVVVHKEKNEAHTLTRAHEMELSELRTQRDSSAASTERLAAEARDLKEHITTLELDERREREKTRETQDQFRNKASYLHGFYRYNQEDFCAGCFDTKGLMVHLNPDLPCLEIKYYVRECPSCKNRIRMHPMPPSNLREGA